MITATTCSNLAEAELLCSLLVENGIEAFVLDDAFGGAIRVQVADDQLEVAQQLLAEAEAAFNGNDDDESGDDDDENGDGGEGEAGAPAGKPV